MQSRHFGRGVRCIAPVALAVAALGLASGVPARAQLGILPKIRLKAGAFVPASSALSGDVMWKVGADASLPLNILPLVGGFRIGIDYEQAGSTSVVPITLNMMFRPSLPGLSIPVYAGAGFGVWTAHISGLGTGTGVGGRLFAGADISKQLFLEAQYDFTSKVKGASLDGFSILVGFKF